ncbi:hypothetical protein [Roseovarius salis]|uniref:hypothetical protein n=1 Tax=Roseovarius salis TaxID=3376063 RepID=UPI0037C8C8A5
MAEAMLWILAALGAVAGALLGRLWGRAEGRREGKREAENAAIAESHERLERGRAAVRDARGHDPAQQLRDNKDRW